MKRITVTAFALCAFVVEGGTTYYMKNGATDFSVAAGYTTDAAGNSPAASAPGASDEVIVPSGTFSIDVSSASFTTLSGVKRVRPSDGAVLEFTAADGVSGTFNAPINWNGEVGNASADYGGVYHYGTIVKKGYGTLVLGSSGNTKSGNYNQDYVTSIDLQEGTLKLPQNAVGNMYFGDVTLAGGTTLVTCGNVDNPSLGTATYVRSINGYGTVTNESGRSSGQVFSPYARDVVYASEFHGRLCDPVRHWLDGRFVQYGHETGITQPLTVQYNYGHLNDGYDRGVYSFEDVALLGSADSIQFFSNGGGIHYFGGVDAVMSKSVNLYSYNHPGFFDAGWHGGIRCTGSWVVKGNDNNNTVQKWLVITGSNTVPCTIEGAFKDGVGGVTNQYGVPYTIVVQKLGSGAWRFKNNRSHAGGFAIEEGTLQFDSIAEKGVASSLGLSTNLTEICSTKNPKNVDYAFSLGSTGENSPAAVFEFTGAKSCHSGTRQLVLKGNGGSIRASGTGSARLVFGGVSALAPGETTLVLDGTNEFMNVASSITDGNGKVSVVKDGSGEWYLSGNNTFSGDLNVKEGILTLLGAKYNWFRFTVRQIANGGHELSFRQLALYDANGIRQNICLKVNPPTPGQSLSWTDTVCPDYDTSLRPGSFAFGKEFFCAYRGDYINEYVNQIFSDVGNTANGGIAIFDGTTSYGKRLNLLLLKQSSGTYHPVTRDNPGSWIPFVMRLTNGAPEIVSYDIESYWNQTNSWPKIASMEASVDGLNWELVETNAFGEIVSEHDYDFSIPLEGTKNSSNKWYSDGTAQVNWDPTAGTTPRPGKGFPIRGRIPNWQTPLQNVRSVHVDENATLRTYDDVTIRSLKVDAAGAGTLDGFKFAANGTLDVVTQSGFSSATALPGGYPNCQGLQNVSSWTLKINGETSSRYNVAVRDGKIYVIPRGFVILFR